MDGLETILGEAIDDEVLPVINGGTLKKAIEPDDKLNAHLGREMIPVGGKFFLPQCNLLHSFPSSIHHRTSNSLKESSEKLLNALLRFLAFFRNL
jgi:hypothetical protein